MISLFQLSAFIVVAFLFCLLSYFIGSFEGFRKGYKEGYTLGRIANSAMNSMIHKQYVSTDEEMDISEKVQCSQKTTKKIYPSYLRRIK